LHKLVPAGHPHCPSEQIMPPVHTVPHAPQLRESLERTTHAPLQSDSPLEH